MSIWTSHLINGIGLLLGFWFGRHLSQRHKGWPLFAVLLGLSVISSSDRFLMPYAYVYSGSRHNDVYGYLAMAASTVLFVTSTVLIRDATIALCQAFVSRRGRRGVAGACDARR